MPRLRIDPPTTQWFIYGEGEASKEVIIARNGMNELHPEGAMLEDRGRVFVREEGAVVYEEVLVRDVEPNEDCIEINVAFMRDRNHGFTMMLRPGDILSFNGDDYILRPITRREEIEVKLIAWSQVRGL